MDTLAAKRRSPIKTQQGTSLVELMLASILGLIIIAAIGQLFISGQQSVHQQSQRLFLQQSLMSTIGQLKEDLQRAGFSQSEQSATFTDDKLMVTNAQKNAITYLYQNPDKTDESYLLTHWYLGQEGEFFYCQNEINASIGISQIDANKGTCYRVFDHQQIDITAFSVHLTKVNGANVNSEQIQITLAGRLAQNHSVSYKSTFSLLNRHWQ